MSQQNTPQKEGQQNDQKQQKQQQPMEKPAGWSMDFSPICGDGNGLKALKVQKRECLAWLLCLLMGAIIFGMLLFEFWASPPMDASMGEQMDNGTFHTQVHECHTKIGQMAEEANAQKVLEKVQNETIAQLRATIQQQEKEIGQMLEEKNSNKKINRP